MNMTVTSAVIGPLTQDSSFADWWTGPDVAIPLFDGLKLPVAFIDFVPEDDPVFIDEADAALQNFLSKTPGDRLSLTPLVYANCLETVEATEYPFGEDEPLRAMTDPTEVWDFVSPKRIYVSRRPRQDKDIYVQIDCECTWEDEHGLLLVYRQGRKLTRLSQQDGHLTHADAYDVPDEEDELLSKF